jgi:hypothetical protein
MMSEIFFFKRLYPEAYALTRMALNKGVTEGRSPSAQKITPC